MNHKIALSKSLTSLSLDVWVAVIVVSGSFCIICSCYLRLGKVLTSGKHFSCAELRHTPALAVCCCAGAWAGQYTVARQVVESKLSPALIGPLWHNTGLWLADSDPNTHWTLDWRAVLFSPHQAGAIYSDLTTSNVFTVRGRNTGRSNQGRTF